MDVVAERHGVADIGRNTPSNPERARFPTGQGKIWFENLPGRMPTNTGVVAFKCDGAVEKTRTSTGCPTATSTLRVYQFRHDRTSQKGRLEPARGM